MKTVRASILLIMFLSSFAFCEIMTQTQDFNFDLSPGSTSFSINQLDDEGRYTLDSVMLSFNVTESALLTVENNTSSSANVSVDLTSLIACNVGGLSATANINDTFGPVSLKKASKKTGGGNDFHNFGLVSSSGSVSMDFTTDLDDFIGLGTMDVIIDGIGSFTAVGAADITLGLSDYQAVGDMSIIYTFHNPEPASVMLLGFGSLIFRYQK